MDLSLDEVINVRHKKAVRNKRPFNRQNGLKRLGTNRFQTQKGNFVNAFKKVGVKRNAKFISTPVNRRKGFWFQSTPRIGIEDARQKIQENKASLSSSSQLQILSKPVDARMRIEARKLGKNQLSSDSVVSAPVIKGILRNPVSYVDHDFVVDDNKDIDFSKKSARRNISYNNVYLDDAVNNDYLDEDMLIDEDIVDDADVYNENLSVLRRTVINDKSISLTSSLPLQLHRQVSTVKNTSGNRQYPSLKRTIDNFSPTKFSTPAFLKPSQAKNSSSTKRSSENSRPPVNSRLGKKTSDIVGSKIVVSNLHNNVTSEDIKELFEDIGNLLSAQVVKPGIAEVVYKLQEDALKAVDVYHNRQLDGQPMKCVLVKQSPSFSAREIFRKFQCAAAGFEPGSMRTKHNDNLHSGPRNSNSLPSVQPDPIAIRKALFSN